MPENRFECGNLRILELMSRYLTENASFIRKAMIDELAHDSVDEQSAFSLLLAGVSGLDVAAKAADRELYYSYFPAMIHQMDEGTYSRDPYYCSVRFERQAENGCTLEHSSYSPYEAFVCDDILCLDDGRRIPQIGYFAHGFCYPAIYENGRLWMSVTPNEINTMKEPLIFSRGRVLSFGLGLGYYAYMASLKKEVVSIDIVEQNENVISLFKKYILPQFEYRDKINIVSGDAFEYAESEYPKGAYDFVFADLWHDVSDGLPMYLRLKRLESLAPQTRFAYWIEKTMLCYL